MQDNRKERRDSVKQKKAVLCLGGFAFLLLFFSTFPSILGSKVDWLTQHVAFPDYFRTFFYQTGKLLPTFAFHLGGGQNIFYFSYYGLLAPWVLLSYLLPFISMKTYTIILFAILFIGDGILCFFFLRNHFSTKISFLGSICLLCSTALLFHTHRHIMFVSYFPFLLLSLLFLDRYFKTGKVFLFLLSTTLILFTNYYYAVPSLLVLGIYTIFLFLKTEKEKTFSSFCKKAFPLLGAVIIAVLTAAILLLPTFFAMKSGRGDSISPPFYQALLPNLDMSVFFYDGYGLGLSVLSFLALLYTVFQKEKPYRLLSGILLVFTFSSIFLFLLNGGQYIRGKVLIPFLPLYIDVLCFFLTHLKDAKQYISFYILGIAGVMFLSLFQGTIPYFPFLLCIDFLLCILLLFYPRKSTSLLYLFFLVIVTITVSRGDQLLSFSTLEEQQEQTIQEVLEEVPQTHLFRSSVEGLSYVNRVFTLETSSPFLYSSLSNLSYKRFYEQFFHAIPNRNQLMLTSNTNLFYDTLMGVRFRYGSEMDSYGYHKVGKKLYENVSAFPIVYGNTKLLNEKVYHSLTVQEQMEALLEYTVVKKEGTSSFQSSQIAVDLPFTLTEDQKAKLHLRREKGHWVIEAEKDVAMRVALRYPLDKNLLLLRLTLLNDESCTFSDRMIVIEGQHNKITCKDHLYRNNNKTLDYLLSTDEDTVSVSISKGKYILETVESTLLSTEEYEKKTAGKMLPTQFHVNDRYDTISFDLTMEEAGYFVSSIPYDEGFTLKVDGKEKPLSIVNTAFLGASLSKGTHHLELSFVPKGYVLGKYLSLGGLFLSVVIFLKEVISNVCLRKRKDDDRIRTR